jgi:hypothetical protein
MIQNCRRNKPIMEAIDIDPDGSSAIAAPASMPEGSRPLLVSSICVLRFSSSRLNARM